MTAGTETLVTAIRRFAAAHPGFAADVDKICRAVEASDLRVDDRDVSAADLEEIVLGFAAATGDSAAIQRFEALYFGRARAALSKMGASPEMCADAIAQTAEVLFVGTQDQPPRIVKLLGNGDLHALVKVVAVRRLLNIQRSRRARPDSARGEDDDALATAIAREPGPELHAIAVERHDLLKSSLAASLGGLAPESRTLLRLSIVHGLSIDDLAGMYGIHRSTAARRLVNIRERLRTDVRLQLAERIDGSTTEVDSVLRVADSKLDLSFERLLLG